MSLEPKARCPGAMRVLIVDDNRFDRADAKAALLKGSDRPYLFTEAATAEEALRLCAVLPAPDCIVLDLGLPDADELGVLSRLPRDEDQLLRVPVVVLTGALTHGLNQAALRAGAHDYVGKAWLRPETLTQAVENAIERLALTRALLAQRQVAEASRIRSIELEAHNHQMAETGRLKSQFMASMSHELRTPLSAIIGFADLLHGSIVPPESPKRAVFLGHIRDSGRHLLRLINDLLDLSKVEAGKLDFFPERVDLPTLVGEVIEFMLGEVERKQLELVAEIDPGLHQLHLDPMRLRQVLYNYLSNAIKFTPAGGRITVRACAQGARHFRLEVQDTGIGISADDLPGLFSDYRQLDAGHARRHQGTGLGLALTRRLAEAQSGSVGARSRSGVGSVFHMLLNQVHGTDALRGAEAAERLAAPNGQSILVLHAQLEQQASMAQALAVQGRRVEACASGDRAVRTAQSRSYDAITLHLQPPAQCGLGVLQRIRSGGLSRESPVVAVTMPVQPGIAVTFAIADVLSKPLSRAAVAAAMARFQRPGTTPTNVLVIDDDPAALELVKSLLLAIGIHAVCLLDGRDALREIEQHQPDAILLDLMMPGFDGFEVLDALRQLPTWCDTPVFICTSLELSAAEYASLTRSARAIDGHGGGSIEGTLEVLGRWRPGVDQQSIQGPIEIQT